MSPAQGLSRTPYPQDSKVQLPKVGGCELRNRQEGV